MAYSVIQSSLLPIPIYQPDLIPFLLKYWGSTYPHMIFQWSKGIVFPPKVLEDLF